MRPTSRSPWPQRTTSSAGVLLLVAGVLQLAVNGRWQIAITETIVVPLFGPLTAAGAAIAEAAAFIVLAVGIAGEVGIVASSLLGRVALILWGLEDLSRVVLSLTPTPDVQDTPAISYVLLGLQLLFTAAAITSAVAVIRTRVLHGPARWTFLLVALVDFVLVALSNPLPFAIDMYVNVLQGLATVPIEFLEPALTLLLAAVLLLWGRHEALKHRARIMHDAW